MTTTTALPNAFSAIANGAPIDTFAFHFVDAMMGADLMGPLVPTDGTNYASEIELECSKPYITSAPENCDQFFPTIWTGTNTLDDETELPYLPIFRHSPRLHIIPGVPHSSADMEAMERMRAWHDGKPVGQVERIGESGECEDGGPGFYSQLLAIKLQQMEGGTTETIDKQDLRLNAQELLETSKSSKLAPTSAMLAEIVRDLHLSAEGERSFESVAANYQAAIKYFAALDAFQNPQQDELGFWTMLDRGLTISMDEAVRTLMFGPKDYKFIQLGKEFARLAADSRAKQGLIKSAIGHKARLVWLTALNAHTGLIKPWETIGNIIGEIPALMTRGGYSEEDDVVAAVRAWVDSARKTAGSKTPLTEK